MEAGDLVRGGRCEVVFAFLPARKFWTRVADSRTYSSVPFFKLIGQFLLHLFTRMSNVPINLTRRVPGVGSRLGDDGAEDEEEEADDGEKHDDGDDEANASATVPRQMA